MDDEVIKDDELESSGEVVGDELIDEEHPKKKKSLLDDESVESAEDLAEEELDEEEPFDDVDAM